ncbi:hypothetical protein ACE103_09270 [Bradyrhizobium sp. ma5]|uniref:hypothetical protein n=1 Tax=Bradyrhizobium sp. ma5 TaxID=3344828 RepID=UPI0035D516E5
MRLLIILLILNAIPGVASAQTPTLNSIVKEVVDDFRQHRSHGGYDLHKAFTRDLKYGNDCCIKATDPPATMCVAGVAEIVVETLNRYAASANDQSPFQKLPLTSWTRGNLTSIRANIFMYDGTGSRGTGHAFEKLGLGKEKSFSELKPYDFVNLNRTSGSGHAVVFISFLDANSNETSNYSANVIGFHYFSAQGKGKPDAGFADRFAYFDGKCPDQPVAGRPRDCGVIRSSNRALLDGGELWSPTAWTTTQAISRITTRVRGVLESRFAGQPRGFIDTKLNVELEKELTPNLEQFNGETTD